MNLNLNLREPLPSGDVTGLEMNLIGYCLKGKGK